jgi:hypothetical protein
MLAIQKRSQVISKKLILPNGAEFLAFFLISEENGQLRAQLLSVRPLSNPEAVPAYLLPSGITSSALNLAQKIASPYCFKTFKDFSFLTKQLTRAPSQI